MGQSSPEGQHQSILSNLPSSRTPEAQSAWPRIDTSRLIEVHPEWSQSAHQGRSEIRESYVRCGRAADPMEATSSPPRGLVPILNLSCILSRTVRIFQASPNDIWVDPGPWLPGRTRLRRHRIDGRMPESLGQHPVPSVPALRRGPQKKSRWIGGKIKNRTKNRHHICVQESVQARAFTHEHRCLHELEARRERPTQQRLPHM